MIFFTNNRLQKTWASDQTWLQKEVVHIHFPPIQQYYGEMLPLLITIFILFLYVYFSCNKIEVSRIMRIN